jgi:energy-coupling factor transport system substrate-specific component
VIGAIGLNVGLNTANNALSMPFFFDSIGTAIVAATTGIGPGIAVAVGTNLLIEAVMGFPWTNIPFALCGIATAFIVWAFVRRGAFSTIGSVLLASLLVALANAVLGSVIATFVYQGVTGVGVDYLVTGLVAAGQSLVSATFWARVPANLFDKTIAVLAAYLVHRSLVARGLVTTDQQF